MKVSHHAEKRMKERLGIGRASCQRIAEKALVEGICNEEVAGRIRRYLDSIAFKKHEYDLVRLYGMFIYIFTPNGDILITVYHIDKKMKFIAQKMVEKK